METSAMQHIIVKPMTPSPEQSAENRRRNERDLGLIATALLAFVLISTCALLSQMQHAADIASRV
jgi:hypothetical protein